MANTKATFSGGLTIESNEDLGQFGGVVPRKPASINLDTLFADIGSGAGKFQVSYLAARSVVSGTPDVIDLSGTLKQVDGVTAAVFTDALGLVIKNLGASNLLVGGGTNPVAFLSGTAPKLIIPPGMWSIPFFGAVANGFPVANGSTDNIAVDCVSGTCAYLVGVIGHG